MYSWLALNASCCTPVISIYFRTTLVALAAFLALATSTDAVAMPFSCLIFVLYAISRLFMM
jgi:hypothetical protein